MSEQNPQNPNAPKAGAAHARKLTCEEWEALLVDFLDGTLTATEGESFQSHQKTCAACAEMFSQASQGREWLNFLRADPPVPAVLVSKILAQTSGIAGRPGLPGQALPGQLLPGQAGAEFAVAAPAGAVIPFWKRAGLLAATQRVAQPRLLMTAAMAFFSITLTLNIAGVRLSAVRLADLKPAAISSNLDKQYHMASARVVRYYDNLRFVYEMEARVRELRRASEQEPAPATAPRENPKPPARDGSPRSTVPSLRPLPVPQDKHSAAEQVSARFDPSQGSEKVRWEVFRALPTTTEDQARRSLV
jgi:anti-sigma factor RsiW